MSIEIFEMQTDYIEILIRCVKSDMLFNLTIYSSLNLLIIDSDNNHWDNTDHRPKKDEDWQNLWYTYSESFIGISLILKWFSENI